MSHTWQTVLAVSGGVLVGWFALRFAERKPRRRAVVDIAAAAGAIFVAVLIGLGHFDRMDAVWPAYAAVSFLAYGFGHTRVMRKPKPSDPDDGGFLHDAAALPGAKPAAR